MKSKQINIPDSKKEIVLLSIFPAKIVYCWMEIWEGGVLFRPCVLDQNRGVWKCLNGLVKSPVSSDVCSALAVAWWRPDLAPTQYKHVTMASIGPTLGEDNIFKVL